MHDALVWIGGGLVVVGVMFTLLGAVGVLRFPDVYTRIHAASLTDTGGASLVLLGLGLTEFSMHPSSVLEVKQIILNSDFSDLRKRVSRALQATDESALGAAIGALADA